MSNIVAYMVLLISEPIHFLTENNSSQILTRILSARRSLSSMTNINNKNVVCSPCIEDKMLVFLPNLALAMLME